MLRGLAPLLLIAAGCTPVHTADVAAPALPALPTEAPRHSGRLWLELGGATADRQCSKPTGHSAVCFDGVHAALASVLAQTAWTSFPRVALKEKGDDLVQGDYVLLVALEVEPREPDSSEPGWSALARARWRLVRDGIPVASGEASSRSRAGFAYGSALGVAGGEVVTALGVHIAERIASVPEAKPTAPVPLPPVRVSLRSTPGAARSLPGAR